MQEGTMNETKIIHNGRLVDEETVRFSLNDTDLLYGYGCYEVLKVRNGLLYFPEDHVERLLSSAEILGFEHDLDRDDLITALRMLVVSLELLDANLRVVVLAHDGRPADWYILPQPAFFPPKNAKTSGVDCLLYQGERHFPKAKSLSMLLSTVAFRAASKRSCYDALLVDRTGEITEGTRTNVFFVDKDAPDTVCTPPASRVLSGITRKTFLQSLDAVGRTWKEAPLRLDEVLGGRYGLLVSSTSTTLVPVARLLDQEGTGVHTLPVFDELKKLSAHYDAWLSAREAELRGTP